MDWKEILIGAGPAVLGVVVTLFWAKVQKMLVALKEFADVLMVFVKAMEDKKLTPEEQADIKREFAEAVAAFKGILKA